MSHVSVDRLICTIDQVKIVDGVMLDVHRGEFVALVGPNGSGKSSLLRTIYRVLRPQAGLVSIEGDDVWQLTAREAARRTAVVAQERIGEFEFTVRDLVAMGRNPRRGAFSLGEGRDDRQIVDRSLEQVGLAGFAGRPFLTLSGGEKQRVLLARALAQQARFLVLDEPTNHLDIRYQLELLQLIRRLGTTTLAALHDLSLAARFCDRIVMLAGGRVVASGPARDVLTAERIRDVYQVDARVSWDDDGHVQIGFAPLAQPAGIVQA